MPRRPFTVRALLALMLLLTSVSCATTESSPPPSWPSPLLGQPLPSLDRPALDGHRVTGASFQGRPVVVKFFAKYCEPCKHTLPAVQSLWAEGGEVAVLGISDDEREAEAREVVRSYGLTFPVIHDRGLMLAARFRVHELPATFVVDREGRIAWFGGPGASGRDIRRAAEAERAP